MGVKGGLFSSGILTKRLKSLRGFKGKAIAIDANAILYLLLYGLFAHDRYKWLGRARQFIETFRNLGIQAIYIFEGRSPPLKEQERIKRAADRKRKAEEKQDAELEFKETKRHRKDIEVALKDLDHCMDAPDEQPLVFVDISLSVATDIMDVDEPGTEANIVDVFIGLTEPPMSVEEMQQLYTNLQNELQEVKYQETQQESKYADANKYSISITPQIIANFKYLLDLYQVPYIQAKFESDYVFGNLYNVGFVNINGVEATNRVKIAAALAKDTDTCTYGVDQLDYDGLSQITNDQSVNHVCIVEDLKRNKLTLSQFKDICFISGNDYSGGIYGYSLIKALDAVKEYGSAKGLVTFLVAKAQTLINKISKMRTCNSENNLKKMVKARKDIETWTKWLEFYEHASQAIVEDYVYEIKLPHLDARDNIDYKEITQFIDRERAKCEADNRSS